MFTIFKLIAFVILFIYIRWFVYPNIRYKSDAQKIVVYVGKPGSFKTTEMIAKGIESRKKGRLVYSNTQLNIDSYELFTMKDLKENQFKFPKHCDIYIDEATDTFDNRKFKSFPQHFLDLLNDYRHDDQNFYFFCQNWDLDKKIRDRATYIIHMSKLSNTVGLQRLIIKKFGLKPAEMTSDSDSQMVDVLDYAPWYNGGFVFKDYEQYFYLTDTHKELHNYSIIPSLHIENKVKKKHAPKKARGRGRQRSGPLEPTAQSAPKETAH